MEAGHSGVSRIPHPKRPYPQTSGGLDGYEETATSTRACPSDPERPTSRRALRLSHQVFLGPTQTLILSPMFLVFSV